MIDFNITDEEIEAIELYRNKDYEAINQMLVSDCETDIALLSADVENKVVNIDYDRVAVIRYLKTIKLLYKVLLKKYYDNKDKKKTDFYRGTNLSEIERIKNELFIDRFLMVSTDENNAINDNASNWNRPVCMNLFLDEDIPYIFIKDFLKGKKYEKEVLISPFTKIKKITEVDEKKIKGNSKTVKVYDVELEKQVLDELTENERNGLYNYILESSYSIKEKIEECIDLEKENITNFENIRKLEQLLAKYENTIEEDEETSDELLNEESNSDDIARVTKELDDLKEVSSNISEKRKNNIEFVNMWKRNIAVYMIAECREIEKEFEKECENFEETKNETIENTEKENENENVSVSVEEPILKDLNNDISNMDQEDTNSSKDIKTDEIKEDKNTLSYRVKTESKENIQEAEKLLKNINMLITKQQNHAKIAGNIGATYSALNNAFEMKKVAEKLLDLLKTIDLKREEDSQKPNQKKNKEKLEKISKINIEISTLMNYLNNPKIAIKNSNATRFDEMAIIEENELKKGIYERIINIRGEAELKKLKEDLEIIEDKSPIKKFFGIFTGRNKLDEFMIEQIEIRQKAIRRTLAKRLGLAYNYSVHEFMAEIKMFIDENEDDELVVDDVTDLKALEEELRRNFIILDSKVQSIIDEKIGRNLPLDRSKLSKAEVIEVETYRFLNKYGYDKASDNEKEEPKYQDTMASEISRIIEYINSSGIL